MNTAFLGLGTNIGNRIQNLEDALSKLEQFDIKIQKISTVYETPALLPKEFDSDWNTPFLNIAIEIKTKNSPKDLLSTLKSIEMGMGRNTHKKWAPRIIDIDILYFNTEVYNSPELIIPHPEIQNRHFVLGPLKELAPQLIHPVLKESQLLLFRKLNYAPPQIMTILNLTPDSFSDGGFNNHPDQYENFCKKISLENAAFIDIGAESTRPGATPLSAEEEWHRIAPFLKFYKKFYLSKKIKPVLSIDTRHGETVLKSLEYGIQIVNDVSSFYDSSMKNALEHIKNTSIAYVLMHNLGIPADPKNILKEKVQATKEVFSWFQEKLDELDKIGLQNIYLDPGIGFGKSPQHSLELLQNISEFMPLRKPILVGHSRKSFLKIFSDGSPSERDIETLGISLYLLHKKIDILRVHNSEIHRKAILAHSHCIA